MKKRILIIGIDMRLAGTEKSLLSYLERFNQHDFDITLLLAKRQGVLLSALPNYINIVEMPRQYADLFLLNKNNAAILIFKTVVIRHPFKASKAIFKFLLNKNKEKDSTMELWYNLMKLMPMQDEEFDEAIAYWGEKTMFYMTEKVNAKKKITRQHFSYYNTKTTGEVYYNAYQKCDRIEQVSKEVHNEFCTYFPELAYKSFFIPNKISSAEIKSLSETGNGFEDNFDGKRILTIARLSHQKGLDIAAKAILMLYNEINIRWYIIGEGEERAFLERFIKNNFLHDKIFLLGEIENPYTYLKECDIYLQPSRYEGLPLTVEEAKILQRPIITSNYLSAKEQLLYYEDALICNLDEHSIYNALLMKLNE